MVVGGLALTPEDLDRLATALAPLVASRLDRDEEKWFTPKQYVEAGYAPSEAAVRKRVSRGRLKSTKEGGGGLLVAGPSNEG